LISILSRFWQETTIFLNLITRTTMKFYEQIQLLQRVDRLIRLKATGSPEALADRLNMSKRTLYRQIEDMRDLGFSIEYDKCHKTYYYKKSIDF
jgi:biotin operon repressor